MQEGEEREPDVEWSVVGRVDFCIETSSEGDLSYPSRGNFSNCEAIYQVALEKGGDSGRVRVAE